MSFWRSIAGMLEVELTSAEIGAALAAINSRGIELFQLREKGELCSSFQIRRRDYRLLSQLCEKRGEKLRLLHKNGLFWPVKGLLSRPILLFGIAILAVIALYLPSRVFFVRVEGNSSTPDRRILAAAEDCGICFGASRREVRSEKVKNALLAAVPELQWAGVNTAGCVAIVSVREGTAAEEPETGKRVTSIVASRDGYILSGTAVQGNALFRVGQSVTEGQVLISGYTDCGICIQATRAEGEVMAQTSRNFEAITPAQYISKGAVTQVKRKYSLLLRKKRIILWKDSGISDSSCGRMYEEYYITLPGGFQLPIALCVEEYQYYETDVQELPQRSAETALTEYAGNYITRQMVAGEIKSRTEKVSLEDGLYRLRGSYVCVEMIGREVPEQIGDTNGKNS